MMYLDTTSKSLQVILAGAVTTNQLPWVSAFGEVAADNTTSAPKASNGVTNSGTAVTVVAAPGASLVRELLHFSVQNADTAAATVTVRLNDGGTFRPIVKVTLQTGENLLYDTGGGWRVLDVDGILKAGAGLLAIGTPIRLGTSSLVLFVDGSQDLAQSSLLAFNGSTLVVSAGSVGTDAAHFANGSYVAALANTTGDYAGSFTDGTNVVLVCNGGFAINVTTGTIIVPGSSGNTYRWGQNAATPTPNVLGGLPGGVYGGTTNLLGDPDVWVLVNVNGTNYKMPCYL